MFYGALFLKMNKKVPFNSTPYIRKFISSKYGDEDDRFHNHKGSGYYYRYPVVQYKVLNGNICILGLAEDLAEKIVNLDVPLIWDLAGKKYKILEKKAVVGDLKLKLTDSLEFYEFITPWLGLNTDNYKKFKQIEHNREKQKELFSKVLKNELISVANGFKCRLPGQIKVIVSKPRLVKVDLDFKNVSFVGNYCSFACNLKIPSLVGIGMLTAFGFGCVKSV